MKSSEQKRLLREILEDEAGSDFRAASLAQGVAFMQRRQRRNHVAWVGAAVVVPLVAFGLAFHLAAKRPAPPPLMGLIAETPKVQRITDEELFALFPHRAVALIGSPGQQELVFVDHGVATDQP